MTLTYVMRDNIPDC